LKKKNKKKNNCEQEFYKFTSSLRYGLDRIVPYEKQMEVLVHHGFVLWDIVQSCTRAGSLDTNIKNSTPNDIHSFCTEQHPSIKRIVIANGSGMASQLFIKHNKEWIMSGQIQPHPDHGATQNAFKRVCTDIKSKDTMIFEPLDRSQKNDTNIITIVSAISVSPAAASHSYEQKRDFWEKYVYQPGLQDFYVSKTTK
jgi:hypoxanthine-DNA glycosylase